MNIYSFSNLSMRLTNVLCVVNSMPLVSNVLARSVLMSPPAPFSNEFRVNFWKKKYIYIYIYIFFHVRSFGFG
jgi:hypothetical protein